MKEATAYWQGKFKSLIVSLNKCNSFVVGAERKLHLADETHSRSYVYYCYYYDYYYNSWVFGVRSYINVWKYKENGRPIRVLAREAEREREREGGKGVEGRIERNKLANRKFCRNKETCLRSE